MEENEIVENKAEIEETGLELVLPGSAVDAEMEPASPRAGRKKVWLWVAGVIVLLVLVGAAYLGGRLLSPQAGGVSGGPGKGLMIMGGKGGPGGVSKSVKIDLEPAPELPKTKPAQAGLLDHREDNSLFLGTGRNHDDDVEGWRIIGELRWAGGRGGCQPRYPGLPRHDRV